MKQTSLIILFLIFVNSPAQAEEKIQSFYEPLQFERIVDGDTFVASGRKIRMWGINAPEKDQPYYDTAKFLLEGFLKNGKLTCKFIEKDKYKRNVMHCLSGTSDIGSMMVQLGQAKDFSKYSGDYYQVEEELAKAQGLGIWKNPKTSGLDL